MSDLREVARRLSARVRGTVRLDAPLAPLTTFRVGGAADVLVEAADPGDLVAVAAECDATNAAVIGRGSNVLVSDDGFRGIVVRPAGETFRVQDREGTSLVLGAGVYLPAAAKLTARLGLSGIEFAAEIPGSVGGAVRMNAGAHERCISDVLEWVDTVDLRDGSLRRREAGALSLGYRTSSLAPHECVIRAGLRLADADPSEVGSRIAELLAWRRAHQPGGLSAGSVFKNPPGDSAGRLVEAAGLKGTRVGGAQVSSVHANFVVVRPGSRAFDVWRLVRLVQSRVLDASGVLLEPEIRRIGTFPQVNHNGEVQVEG